MLPEKNGASRSGGGAEGEAAVVGAACNLRQGDQGSQGGGDGAHAEGPGGCNGGSGGGGGAGVASKADELCIIFNLGGVALKNLDLQAAKRIIYMLSNFYPERMGVCLLVSSPLIFSATWAIISPWLSTRTQQKIHFIKPDKLSQWIAHEALPSYWNGSDDTVYCDQDAADVACKSTETLNA